MMIPDKFEIRKLIQSLLVGAVIGLVVTAFLVSSPPSPEPPLKECAEIHIVQMWSGAAPDGSGAAYLSAFVHEKYEFVIDMKAAIPMWPDALLCFYPPLPPQDST